MKKVMMVLAALMLTVLVNGQSLKGFTIGKKLFGKATIMTTVAGIKGQLDAMTLNDGRIWAIGFRPTKDGIKVLRVHESDIERLVKGLEKTYNIKLIESTNEYSNETEAYYTKDFAFFLQTKHNQFMDSPYEIGLLIASNELKKIYENEEQAKANLDF